jgi:thymidine kinase
MASQYFACRAGTPAAGCGRRLDERTATTVECDAMEYPGRGGWIEVVSGVMFSGKSEELLRRVRRAVLARKRVQVFKSHLDERYGGLQYVSTHDGGRIESEPVSTSVEVMERLRAGTEVVAIDEVQFLDAGIVDVANAMADANIRVIVAGTDMDFRGAPFGPIGALLAVAERIDKLQAICIRCGRSPRATSG